MTEYRKIKDMNRPGNVGNKTNRQIDASRKSGLKVMLTNNPMRNPKSIEKIKASAPRALEKRRHNPNFKRILFKKGNQFGKLRKNTKISDKQKLMLSIKHLGKPVNPKSNAALMRYLIFNGHPMNNPELVKKCAEANRKKFPVDVLENIKKEFLSGKSITQLAKENKVDRGVLSKILKANQVAVNRGERIRMYNLTNPRIISTQFKKSTREVENEKSISAIPNLIAC